MRAIGKTQPKVESPAERYGYDPEGVELASQLKGKLVDHLPGKVFFGPFRFAGRKVIPARANDDGIALPKPVFSDMVMAGDGHHMQELVTSRPCLAVACEV